jgi:hypothetical protein
MNTVAFKRLSVGDRFHHKGGHYRKVHEKHAIKLKESGRGETHARIRFHRSTNVEVDINVGAAVAATS